MKENAGLAAVATLMSVGFALSTWERYRRTGRIHHLAWTLSMAMFAAASLAFWWATSTGWNEWNFRLFYLFGAILNVPYLAMGTVALLGRDDLAARRLAALNIVAAFCAGVIIAAPMSAEPLRDGLPSGRELFGPGPRIMAAIGSGVGATILIVGAVVSAVRLIRVTRGGTTRIGPVSAGRLVITNTAIAFGSLILGVGGGLSDTDQQRGFALALATGVTVLFVGFLVSNPKTLPGPRPGGRSARNSSPSAAEGLA